MNNKHLEMSVESNLLSQRQLSIATNRIAFYCQNLQNTFLWYADHRPTVFHKFHWVQVEVFKTIMNFSHLACKENKALLSSMEHLPNFHRFFYPYNLFQSWRDCSTLVSKTGLTPLVYHVQVLKHVTLKSDCSCHHSKTVVTEKECVRKRSWM